MNERAYRTEEKSQLEAELRQKHRRYGILMYWIGTGFHIARIIVMIDTRKLNLRRWLQDEHQASWGCLSSVTRSYG